MPWSAWIAHAFFWVTGARNENGTAYGLQSGIGGSLPDAALLFGVPAWYWRRTCHVRTCLRLRRHHVDGTGIVTCRRHHPVLGAHRHLTAEKILRLHREHLERISQ